MRAGSRAECHEALPVYSVLHALALTSDMTQDGVDRRIEVPKGESGRRFVDREKGFEDIEKSGFVEF